MPSGCSRRNRLTSSAEPGAVASKRARDMGYAADTSIDEIIQAHIEDELGGKIAD